LNVDHGIISPEHGGKGANSCSTPQKLVAPSHPIGEPEDFYHPEDLNIHHDTNDWQVDEMETPYVVCDVAQSNAEPQEKPQKILK
jgi:hypothetical protein